MRLFINLLAGNAGGQVTRAKAFLSCIRDDYPDIEMVILKDACNLVQYGGCRNIKIIDITFKFFFKALQRFIWENLMLSSLVKKQGADVYITFSHSLPFGNFSIPTLVGVSNLAPFSKEAIKSESLLMRLKLALLRHTITNSVLRASSVLALSETCRLEMQKIGVSGDKIIVASNGVDDFWSMPAERFDFKSYGVHRPFLLYVSNFHRYKNHKRLIEAYKLLPSDLRDEYQLVLIGKVGSKSLYGELSRFIYGDSDIVMISGANSLELRAFYQSASLFLFPSLIENSPNIMMEAMKAGAPSIVSSLATMTEFYGSNGLYFDPLDSENMATQIENILKDDSILSALALCGKARANQYTWKYFTDKVIHQAVKLQSENSLA